MNKAKVEGNTWRRSLSEMQSMHVSVVACNHAPVGWIPQCVGPFRHCHNPCQDPMRAHASAYLLLSPPEQGSLSRLPTRPPEDTTHHAGSPPPTCVPMHTGILSPHTWCLAEQIADAPQDFDHVPHVMPPHAGPCKHCPPSPAMQAHANTALPHLPCGPMQTPPSLTWCHWSTGCRTGCRCACSAPPHGPGQALCW